MKSYLLILKLNKHLVVLNSILVGILWVIIPLVTLTVITSKTPILFGLRSYVVLTGSMEPTIPTGSVLFTLPSKNYQAGDIIAFDNGQVTVTHRIIKVQDQSGNRIDPLISPLKVSKPISALYQTQGDANKTADSHLISNNKIMGKALFHFPSVGKLILALKTPIGFILLIVIPTLAFIFMELLNIKKEVVKQTEKKILERMQIS